VEQSSACGNCDEPLAEATNTPVIKRQPCPKCGSTSRRFSGEMHVSMKPLSASFNAEVVSYPKDLAHHFPGPNRPGALQHCHRNLAHGLRDRGRARLRRYMPRRTWSRWAKPLRA
jgi:hypothetical protein